MTDPRLVDRLPEELPPDPLHWADAWLKEATTARVQRNPNSMTLVTVGTDGMPTGRAVLCKELVPDPGYLVFFTNYQSRKAREIAAHPKVGLVFHWDAIGRQVRIHGTAVLSPPAESDAYFASRDRGSQVGAWGSDQSRPIASRDALLAQIRERAAELGVSADDGDDAPPVPRPPHWGGIRVWASSIELWIEGADRVHDRAEWTRELVPASEHEFSPSPWTGARLQP